MEWGRLLDTHLLSGLQCAQGVFSTGHVHVQIRLERGQLHHADVHQRCVQPSSELHRARHVLVQGGLERRRVRHGAVHDCRLQRAPGVHGTRGLLVQVRVERYELRHAHMLAGMRSGAGPVHRA